MKKLLRILAVVLLLFLGFGGIYGAWMLISDPSGAKFEWSLDLLKGTPFRSFLIPGIVLLLSNGVLPLIVASSIILKWKNAGWLMAIQGSITIVWLAVQLVMNPDFFVPEMHYPSFGIGVLMLIIASTGLMPGYFQKSSQGPRAAP